MKYRKKPVVVDAIQWDGTEECFKKLNTFMAGRCMRSTNDIVIDTLEGAMKARVHDWIIKGVQGEFYPCKPEIFEETYEEA